MANRNSSRRRSKKKELKKKTAPPVGLITMGAGIILIGIAALFLMPKADSAANAKEEEYSSIPMEVEFDAPKLELENLSGETESLADYRGKVVMVNLWATWCPPCIAEIPMLQEYYDDHSAKGFVMLGIDSQETPEKVENYITATGVTYPIWIDERGDAGVAFNSFSLPASFVIDREGTVRLAWTGQISKSMLEKHLTPIIEQ